ncbi:hypothetical protein Tco_0857202, partial [Tanacetum coccineum]
MISLLRNSQELKREGVYFMWMDASPGPLTPQSHSSGTSSRPSHSPGTSSRPSHSPRSAQNLGMAECSNCKFLAERIKTLEARISVLEGQLEMARHPENHTLELEAIVERMLDKCISDGEFQQAIGISIECRRLDKLKEAIISSDNVHATLAYCMIISHAFINRREYRSEVLLLLVKVYQDLASPDYLNICQRLMFLDLPEGVANILEKLLRSENKDDAMMAFQIAFDLIENEHQAFLLSVRDRLSSP